jgi:threonine/homoserine/homoserine lactone efflux protein
MPWPDFIALLAFLTATAFTPGPNTTLSTALAANRGLRGALHFVCAVPVGWALLFGVCLAGVGALIATVPPLRWAVKALGVAYLLWLAYKLARTTRLAEADSSQLDVTFWQGAALQFVNIKAWMAALTVSAGWVTVAANSTQRALIVLPVLVAYAFFSNLAYALIGSSLRGWLAQGQRLAWFNRAMAAVLVLTALWMGTV